MTAFKCNQKEFTMRWRLFIIFVQVCTIKCVEQDRQEEGYPVGFLTECPGSNRDTTIPNRYVKEMFFLAQTRIGNTTYKKKFFFSTAVDNFTTDSRLDLMNRKTVIFFSGFMDSTVFPFAQMVGEAYTKKQYNALLFDATRLLSYAYPISARLVRTVGKKVSQVLIELYRRKKLNPQNVELLGFSLGSHISSFISKNFFKETGLKLSRITGLDPAGPCFRRLGPEDRLDKTDSHFVDVVHTNIDGYGIAKPLGHIDYYVNGGEFQVSGYPEVPCLMTCSHLRAVYIWISSLEYTNKFIAMKCDSIQQARDSKCYDRKPQETAVFGLKIDRNLRGIYFLSTGNNDPYYMGVDGLVKEKDAYLKVMSKFNKDENLMLS